MVAVSDNGKHKLSLEQKRFVIGLLAAGYSPEHIVQELATFFDISVTPWNIRKNYQKAPRYRKQIEELAVKIDEEVQKHPLAKKVTRLDFLLKTINEAFLWQDSKITTDKHGNETEHIEKRQLGIVPIAIREAGALVEGLPLSGSGGMTLVAIVKEVTAWEKAKEEEAEKNGRLVDGGKSEVGSDEPGSSDPMDQSDFGDIEIL